MKRGFTLIELLVVIFMVMVMGIVLASLFSGQNKIYQTQTAELNVTSDARFALDDIDSSTRNADLVLGVYGGYTTGVQTLVLQIPSINASSQIIPATFDYFIYYLSGTNLMRELVANALSTRFSATKKMASKVTGLAFTYNNANMALVTEVTTDLTIQETVLGQTRAITISSKSKLRNN